MHGANKKGKISEFATQLREKQKVRRTYGLMEKQFRNTFTKASKAKGVTSENFFKALELRLDNVVFRMGFARSRNESRQIVSHNHVLVNGKRVNVASALVKVGEEVSITAKSHAAPMFGLASELYSKRVALPWFNVDHSKFSGKITGNPTRDDIQMAVRDRLIVELYNK
jgi:small subunit ribosomal protein S4